MIKLAKKHYKIVIIVYICISVKPSIVECIAGSKQLIIAKLFRLKLQVLVTTYLRSDK